LPHRYASRFRERAKRLHQESATDVDHLIPIASGGDDSLANLRPSCARCNRGWR
jgi:5-methylcytosine-specific restriction endonuclease McrA